MYTSVQGLEQVAFEQDKESDRLAILSAMQHHRKELSRYGLFVKGLGHTGLINN